MTRRAPQWMVGLLMVVAVAFGSVAAASVAVAAPLPAYGPIGPGPTVSPVVTQGSTFSQAASAQATSGGSGLAFTGTDAVFTIAAAAGAIALGGMLVLVTRKRRQLTDTA